MKQVAVYARGRPRARDPERVLGRTTGADLNPDDTLPWVNDPEADRHRQGASALS